MIRSTVTRQIGGYELHEILGVGSRTTVYAASHRSVTGLKAAVKVLHPDLAPLQEVREELRREAELLARLRHPHIVRVLDFVEDGELFALIVEFVQGRALTVRLTDDAEVISVRRVLQIFRTLVEALGHAHGMGLVHGQLAPSGIVISDSDEVKLLDFGRVAGQVPAEGSPNRHYLAPGRSNDTPMSVLDDIYSLGRIGEAMLLGREVRERQASSAALEEAGAPTEFASLLRDMGCADPQRRPGSCVEVLALLDRLGGSFVNRAPVVELNLGHCKVDLVREEVHRGDEREGLTTNEAGLLRYLARNAGRVITRDQLMRDVWGVRGCVVTRAVDVAVRRLRKKIEPDPAEPRFILTVHGQGYRFEPPPAESEEPVPATREEHSATETETTKDDDRSDHVIELDGRIVQGRKDALVALRQLFESGARLVTLTGPGGMGKTFLARVFAEQQAPAFLGDASAWFCDLQGARNREEMLRAASEALGIVVSGAEADDDTSAVGKEIAALGPCLILLDNFEQLVDSASDVVETWLGLAREARFLVTSQALLGLTGERVYELPPLDEEPAVALFLERARDLRYDFTPTEDQVDDIRTIVRELDRIPLAVELAASRIRMLSTRQLRERLSSRFELLRAQGGTSNDRSRTLRGAIEWSWQLLSVEEQHVLAQTTIFCGGFSAEAAEAVIEFPHGPTLVLDLLQGLVDRSLLRCVEVPGLMGLRRFTFFESIYAYALEHLTELTSLGALRERHRDYYLQEAERLATLRDSKRGLEARRLLELEVDNLLRIQSGCTLKDSNTAIRIALVLEPILQERGPAGIYESLLNTSVEHAGRGNSEALIDLLYARSLWRRRSGGQLEAVEQDIEALSAQARESCNPLLLARASLYRAGGSLLPAGHIAQAEGQVRAALLTVESMGRPLDSLLAFQHLSHIAEWKGEMEEAESHAQRALAIAQESGLRRREGNCLRRLGVIHCNLGKQEEAAVYFREAIEIHESFDNPRSFYACLGLLSDVLIILEQHQEAERLLQESVRKSQSLKDQVATAMTRGTLGRLELDRGDPGAAIEHIQEAVQGQLTAGWTVGAAISRIAIAIAHLQLDQLQDASAQMDAALEVLTAQTQQQAYLQGLCVRSLISHRLGNEGGASDALEEAHKLAAEQGEIEQALVGLITRELDPGTQDVPAVEHIEQLSKRSLELRSLYRTTQ